MTTVVVEGWDGGNPLHVLAALGLLRIADRVSPGVRMGWRCVGGRWHPFFESVPDVNTWADALSAALRAVAQLDSVDPALNRRVRELSTQQKKLSDQRKKRTKESRQIVREGGLSKAQADQKRRELMAPVDEQISALERELRDAQSALQNANGLGVAHIGDAIGVDCGAFRAAGEQALHLWPMRDTRLVDCAADPALVVAQMPGLACDAIHDKGKVVPTPFSFSNGSSGQLLLKDFRACASRVTAPLLVASMTGRGVCVVEDVTSLNWDPSDQVSHALVWQDPQDRTKATDVSANAMAYLGLSLLPSVPVGNQLAAVGWTRTGGFVWPIWPSPLPIDVVASLLATVALGPSASVESLRARGVTEVRTAAKVNPDGKRNFFAPSVPVA